jgi:Signal transduction histidine kinase
MFRVRQLAMQFNRTLEARVSERTRIARDLHDTLLQSFQGAVLRFHSVVKVLPAGADEARTRLDRALDQADAAITEGRNAVQGLRASATTVNDLANGIAALGVELTSELTVVEAPVIDIRIDGESRNLNPLSATKRFASPARRCATRSSTSGAQHVTVTIHYERRQLRLVIRDDGKGIDAETMARQQAASHFGLPGMRERAAIVNGQLDVRSERGAGTEIELRVPGNSVPRRGGPRRQGSEYSARHRLPRITHVASLLEIA